MRAYFVGIGGIGMSGVAGLAKGLGFEVFGSENGQLYPPASDLLKDLGIEVLPPKVDNLRNLKPDILVVGNTIRSDHPEVVEARKLGIPLLSFPEFIEHYILSEKKTLVVAGTHGKTTTTALLAYLLEMLGDSPSFLVGGIVNNFQKNYHLGHGNWLVIEGDEYPSAFFNRRAKFFHYKPYGLILTSLEFDHGDVYTDLDALKETFRELLLKIDKDGFAVYHADDPNVVNIISGLPNGVKRISYGRYKGDYRLLEHKSTFSNGLFLSHCHCVDRDGKNFSFCHSLLGIHNSLNILSVLALLETLGFHREVILQKLGSFKGVKRRQEIIFFDERNCLIDDFAHHPTAVEVTLRELKEAYRPSKTILFFEPRTNTSKRKVFQEAYIKALSLADVIALKEPPNLEKIPEIERIDLSHIVKTLKDLGKEALILNGNHSLSFVKGSMKRNLIVFMSSAYMEKEIKEVLKLLKP